MYSGSLTQRKTRWLRKRETCTRASSEPANTYEENGAFGRSETIVRLPLLSMVTFTVAGRIRRCFCPAHMTRRISVACFVQILKRLFRIILHVTVRVSLRGSLSQSRPSENQGTVCTFLAREIHDRYLFVEVDHIDNQW